MKKLVDAIVDAEVAAQKLCDEASTIGKGYGKSLSDFTRKLLKARQMGLVSKERARELYVVAFSGFSLGGFVKVAERVVSHADDITVKISKENKRVGKDAAKIPAVTKATFLARELEKANGSD